MLMPGPGWLANCRMSLSNGECAVKSRVMTLTNPFLQAIRPVPAACVAAFAVLTACAPAPLPGGINDPNEAANREVHEANKALDRALVGPASTAYGGVIPEPVRQGLNNVSGNLDLPNDVVNGVLQGRPGPVLENTFRFLINTTVGIGGLFDPARAIGINGKPTDFGETLHVWGFAEGAYGELPLIGPTTTRDTVGRVVDVALNPLRLALPTREGNLATAASVASRLGDRFKFDNTVDSILYDSADSYAQARLLYLQNRRFELGQTGADPAGGGDEDFFDPYEDN
jgi:phospholipid-binding lipoprotein MlaA